MQSSPASVRPFTSADLMLRRAGLRPTRQRLHLARLLFGQGDRHLTADMLLLEAEATGLCLPKATIYNALNAFARAGLLREVAVDGTRTWFDTHTAPHHHFVDAAGQPIDMDTSGVSLTGLPQPPAGQMIASIEIIVRLKSA
jgi:Fur family iron response transcriptional regulator